MEETRLEKAVRGFPSPMWGAVRGGGNPDIGCLGFPPPEAGRLLGEVRLAHLRAHLEVTPVLTPEQRTRYTELRGYAVGKTDGGMHKR